MKYLLTETYYGHDNNFGFVYFWYEHRVQAKAGTNWKSVNLH